MTTTTNTDMAQALRERVALWRLKETTDEPQTEFDKGYEQASDECADALEHLLGAHESRAQPASVADVEAMLKDCVPGGDIVDPQVVADNIRQWLAAVPQPASVAGPVAWEYYYRVDECNAESAHDPDCICWHPEGGGPFKDAKHDESSPLLGWRRTTHPREPARDAKRDRYMFIGGWRTAADWARRPDLISDIGSPAWEKELAAMAQESGDE